ncbi:MAG: hypothetical protein C0618_08515, partial [Desulfuromonas sp.]
KNSEDTSVLTGSASWASSADVSSTVGSYAISGNGYSSGNYDFVQDAENTTALSITEETRGISGIDERFVPIVDAGDRFVALVNGAPVIVTATTTPFTPKNEDLSVIDALRSYSVRTDISIGFKVGFEDGEHKMETGTMEGTSPSSGRGYFVDGEYGIGFGAYGAEVASRNRYEDLESNANYIN